MNQQEFADMFEQYAKTPRGIAFLNSYLATAFSHCHIDHDDSSEYRGLQHAIEFSPVTEVMAEELNKA